MVDRVINHSPNIHRLTLYTLRSECYAIRIQQGGLYPFVRRVAPYPSNEIGSGGSHTHIKKPLNSMVTRFNYLSIFGMIFQSPSHFFTGGYETTP